MTTPIASILPQAWTQFFDDNGAPASGGSVYFYIPNTTTLKNVYQDPLGMTLQTNPVILDAGGRIVGVYGEGTYSMAVYDALGNLIYTGLTQDILALVNLPATTRVRLSAPLELYVSTTGSDSNPGTIGQPFLTIQHALNYVQTNLDLNQFSVTINVADGTYTGAISVEGVFIGGGQVYLVGDTTTPANCIISVTGGHAVSVGQGAVLSIAGFTTTTISAGSALIAYNGGQLNVNGVMHFGAVAWNHMCSIGPASLIYVTSNYTITGSAGQCHWSAYEFGGAAITINPGLTVTLTGTPSFGTAFAYAASSNTILCATLTFVGSATGVIFLAAMNGVLVTGTNNLSYLPGSIAGVISSGGVYNTLNDISLQAIQGNFKNLVIAYLSTTEVNITADAVALLNSSFVGPGVQIVSLPTGINLTVTTSGLNGLDTGTLANSTWYYIYVLGENSTGGIGCLMSLSATAPTLPSNWSYFARVGALRINSGGTVVGFVQRGRDVQYEVGTNLAALPVIASGSAGSISTPTWVPAALANFVPATAAKIRLFLAAFTNGTFSIVAPNNAYGALNSTSNSPPLVSPSNGGVSVPVQGEFVLESTSIYYASDDTASILQCLGYTDNI